MLIKEYRIPLPLTVEEYRIAQLYMIAKKSREESSGTGSGVEIIINEPYSDGPGGEGQYTRKIYHIASHLPAWIKSLLSRSNLTVEEEAWNAYPYTKTKFTCSFIEKFSVEIETYYFPDNGYQENVFKLSGTDLRNRIVDLIDVVKDPVYNDYVKEEDPRLFRSEKSGRGPLTEDWLNEYWNEVKGKEQPFNGKSLMCAYKLCRVEFRYWGMQTKLEKYIHDSALRKTMLRAHRQAWAWQDEWHGLTMDDIRKIEAQTQAALQRKMRHENTGAGAEESPVTNTNKDLKTLQATLGSIEMNEDVASPSLYKKAGDTPAIKTESGQEYTDTSTADNRKGISGSASSRAPAEKEPSKWAMESLASDSDSHDESEEEFFDCQGEMGDTSSLAKWSSMDLLNEEDLDGTPTTVVENSSDSIFSSSYLQRVASERSSKRLLQTRVKGNSIDVSYPDSPTLSPSHLPCSTSVLFLVFHAGSVLDANVDITAKKSDVTTFRGAFESVMRQHYPSLVGHIVVKLISCPSICTDGLGILSSLSPYSFDVSPSSPDAPTVTHDSIPIGAMPLLATSSPEYKDIVSRVISNANSVFQDFLKSEEGKGFNGQVCVVGDCMGSIILYDALCRTSDYQAKIDSDSILNFDINIGDLTELSDKTLLDPCPRRSSSSKNLIESATLNFAVSHFFMFGSPLALVLAYRKVSNSDERKNIVRPNALQVYNLFHPTDPVASRLEPLVSARFSLLPPVNVARYVKYPLGNGQPYHLLEILQSNSQMFVESMSTLRVQPRRFSEISIQSTASGVLDSVPIQIMNSIQQKWWGNKRLDYALYCPEGLSNFPTNVLPHLFHSSYWESCDVIAFILRQVGRFDGVPLAGEDNGETDFKPGQPREKWIRKRTSVKVKGVAANHCANDVIVREGAPQTLVAKFMYGPFNVVTLKGEKVDIHVMKDPTSGEWTYVSTVVTDKTGKVAYTLKDEEAFGYGLFPVKMVVRGDHTSIDFYLAVLPPKTECVVFSIDGSFTASMSVSGKDPKVRAGAVDVVRHWQELGYMIIYITGRPDWQQQKVVSWLSQHNFPHGLMSFVDGLSTDPLGHKAAYLNNLVQNHGISIHMAYGSSKDISVYSSVGLKPKQIYTVGKASKKQHSQATVLSDGYAAHLTGLMAHGGSRPAQGNARMVIPRGYFGLPGQCPTLRRTRYDGRTAP